MLSIENFMLSTLLSWTSPPELEMTTASSLLQGWGSSLEVVIKNKYKDLLFMIITMYITLDNYINKA